MKESNFLNLLMQEATKLYTRALLLLFILKEQNGKSSSFFFSVGGTPWESKPYKNPQNFGPFFIGGDGRWKSQTQAIRFFILIHQN